MGVFICQSCGTEQSAWAGQCPSCGNTEIIKIASRADRMIDRIVDGRYRIVRKLGQGGMGAVYLAELVGIGHKVALKFLKSDLSEDADIARRFLNEAKSYALVAHPNAVVLHDFKQDDEGNLFIAMEYFEGEDLKRILAERGRLSLPEAAEIILQVADVLGHAHTRGVVHRDLKPENVMIRKGLRGIHVKVLDFGIARLMGESTKLTMRGSIAGTPRYMAPEQVEGTEVDHRVDIYALGVVFFELLTGVQPFDGQTIAEILRNQVVKPMPHLADAVPAVDAPEIDAVIQKATAKSREQRFGDMTAFAHALVEALPTLAQGPALSLATSSGQDAARREVATPARLETLAPPVPDTELAPPRRSRLAALATVGLGIAAVGGVAAVVALGRYRPPEDVPLQLPAEGHPRAAEVAPSPAPAPEAIPAPEVRAGMLEVRASEYVARARTAYKAGDFVGASVFLNDVPASSAHRAEAEKLRATIEGLEKRLGEAKSLAKRGDCEGAIRMFEEVLKVNDGVQKARQGIQWCRQAERPSTLE
ncbi:MAG: protein kinase [Myxococcales bacterium]|nr:protein kinase [Myxococcales bacterium]